MEYCSNCDYEGMTIEISSSNLFAIIDCDLGYDKCRIKFFENTDELSHLFTLNLIHIIYYLSVGFKQESAFGFSSKRAGDNIEIYFNDHPFGLLNLNSDLITLFVNKSESRQIQINYSEMILILEKSLKEIILSNPHLASALMEQD